ncbi:MAG: biopolymer transporter ExbD [Candidatus Eisenbacteria bacterium]|nr:biopolymer transporter ExbD [Candidatus Eisenbacteria bacterium]
MINVRNSLRGGNKSVDISMGPLIDMVFLLLIFFAVTTSFVKEAGIDVQKATASTAELQEHANIMIGVTPEGDVYFEGKRIDVRSVRAQIERALAEDPESGVVVVADKRSETGAVITVMDQCRLAGAKSVSLAAKRGEAS